MQDHRRGEDVAADTLAHDLAVDERAHAQRRSIGSTMAPLSKTGAELLFEVFSRRYERLAA